MLHARFPFLGPCMSKNPFLTRTFPIRMPDQTLINFSYVQKLDYSCLILTKIQCDVKQPSCANCNKKGLECSFLLLAPASQLSVFSSTSPKTPQAPTASPASTLEFEAPISPLRTPSHYSTPSEDLAVISTIPLIDNDPPWDSGSFSTSLVPFQQTNYPYFEFSHSFDFSQTTMPPTLRFNDAWKDTRTQLPTSLQEILNHYEYTTSLTLATDDPAKAAWQTYVPELARNHDFLVNCVLSVASLHLSRLHESKDEKTRMNAIAAARMNKALTRYRPELTNITQQNATALFASATLTAVYLFRTAALDIEVLRSSIPPGTSSPEQHTVDKILACALRPIWGLRGPLTVLMSAWTFVVGGKLQPVTARQWWPRHRVPATARAVAEDERLSRLEDLWMETDRRWGLEHAHLSAALNFLRDAYALVSQLTRTEKYSPMTAVPYSVDDETVGVLADRGAIFVWMTRISREFIQLVEARDRDALVVFAYYAVLPGRVRNVWWLEGLGADMVTAVAMALGRENWGLVAWPASVVGVDLENLFGARKDRLEGMPEEMGMEVI
ncbi:hypothetical protein CC86DRAFT_337868 [Ophiobolus disseminans]|uniref:Zn(2)-C6 fungal-type domain-containing protein n=1 Tax=Ophiobolus disseminans TaxID=1469910 RepID=A0A6A7AI26_9PLEO|nr:hypothetical protein CC86DRAFT_337868 [Ophiobolus disseminans]